MYLLCKEYSGRRSSDNLLSHCTLTWSLRLLVETFQVVHTQEGSRRTRVNMTSHNPRVTQRRMVCTWPCCRKLCKDIKAYAAKALDSGKEINLVTAVRSGTISKGLKYSLATGNWGAQGTQGVRAGVSQVRPSLLPSLNLYDLE